MKFYSQVGQDRFLFESFFRGKRDGVFVEVGAYDGETFSNTLFFEQTMGWTGLLIEPIPSVFERLTARRNAICENTCVSDFEGEAEFVDSDAGIDEKMLSGLAQTFDPRHVARVKHVASGVVMRKLPVTRLSKLLEKHQLFHVDYMSIDTEGAELSILKELDFDRFHISVLTIENNYDDPRIAELMISKGYEYVGKIEQDYLFKRPELKRQPRTSVICSVWHGDPKRLELLRGHQENLARQTVPIQPVYVFDSGDTVPDWLEGRAIATREKLTIYQAWNVALSMVDTPLVMNLNLDDRLAPNGVELLENEISGSNAAAIGGEWRIRYSQADTDDVEPCYTADRLGFDAAWPPQNGMDTRLGSGTGERQTLGPAVMWRMQAHIGAPRFPYRLSDGTLLQVAGDAAWWHLLKHHHKARLARIPVVIGNYHSHPSEQGEFRMPANEMDLLQQQELSLI